MMNAVADWLRQVIAAAFFAAAAAALIPKGAVKKIVMLSCSVLLLMTLFRPFAGKGAVWERNIENIEEEILSAAADLNEENCKTWEGLIEAELVSYIETRAAGEGLSCAVDITFETNDEGVPLPVAVQLTAQQRSEAVHRSVREDLGIAEENIRWRIG